MKKVIIGILIFLGALALVYFYFFHITPIKKNNPLAAVPSDALVIVQMEDPIKQWENFTTNKIWDFLKTNPSLKETAFSIDSLNAEMKKNSMLWQLVASRPMVFSMHRIKDKQFDFLYTIDLQEATQLKFFKNYIEKAIGNKAKVFTRKYGQEEIIEYSYNDSPTTYYLSVSGNILIVSTTHTLIESSISERVDPLLIRDLDFLDVNRYLDIDGTSIYINHADLINFSKQWTENAFIQDLKASKYSSSNLSINDEFITLMGYTNMPEADESLFKALINSGKAEVNIGEVTPDYASSFVSIGFADVNLLYDNLFDVLKSGERGEDFKESKRKLEKFLNISFEEDFLSWISNEIGIIQLNSSTSKANIEVALAIKHNGKEAAQTKLDFLERQIKRKTPVKFQGVDYKGYRISYLSIKGFFKIFFGKLFKQIDKPYYTILDDYVVFSNSPKTLGKIITATIENTTLDSKEGYAGFMGQFHEKSNLFVYMDTKKLMIDAKRVLENESITKIQKHKKYIEGFPTLGIQVGSHENLISHTLKVKFNSQTASSKSNQIGIIVGPELQQLELNTTSDEYVIAIENILPEDLNDKSLTETFSNGQLKFEVPLKDGLKHGRYSEYDSLGNLIIKGRFKNDEKSGIWKFYDAKGDLIKREKY